MTYAISFPGFTQSVGLSSCIRDSLNNVKKAGERGDEKGLFESIWCAKDIAKR